MVYVTRISFLGILTLPLLVSGCFFETKEHIIFECLSQDGAYLAESVVSQGGGAAGAQYVHVFISKAGDKPFRSGVLTTSTSNKMELNWDSNNNLSISIAESVKIHQFKNHFDDVRYWNKQDSGNVSFQYKPFQESEKVSLCVN